MAQLGEQVGQATQVGRLPRGGHLGEQVTAGGVHLLEQVAAGGGEDQLAAPTVVGVAFTLQVAGVDLLLDEAAGGGRVDLEAVGDVPDAGGFRTGAFDGAEHPNRAELDARPQAFKELGAVAGPSHQPLEVEQDVVEIGQRGVGGRSGGGGGGAHEMCVPRIQALCQWARDQHSCQGVLGWGVSLRGMSGRVGLLGGTFDPPHIGHLVVAECVRVEFALDEVRLLVAGDPWMKCVTSPADVRVRLARAAVADDPNLHVDPRETQRAGATYTADTLEELAREQPEVERFFILGADAAAALPRWERVEAALDLATFVAVSRPGHELALPAPLAARVRTAEVPHVDVSSTELRARYGQGRATRYLVPPGADDLIRALGLYGVHDG